MDEIKDKALYLRLPRQCLKKKSLSLLMLPNAERLFLLKNISENR